MKDALIVLISYLIGSISFSFLLTKYKLKSDIREYGSGNAGTTNVLRVLGKKYAALVLIGDVLKGVIAVLMSRHLASNELSVILSGVAVISGHNWPIFMGFRGGKGIATSIGVFLAYDPSIALICVFIGVVIIVLSKYVSLGSIIGMSVLPVIVYVLGRGKHEFYFAIFVSIVSIYRHRSNIVRLIEGNENKIKF